jgi:hypothetical protein
MSVIKSYIKILEERCTSTADESYIKCVKRGARYVSILHRSIKSIICFLLKYIINIIDNFTGYGDSLWNIYSIDYICRYEFNTSNKNNLLS